MDIVFLPIIVFSSIMIFCLAWAYIENSQNKKEEELYNQKLFDASISEIDKMTGIDFERFCKVLFEKKGYSVKLTKASGDYGIDLLLYKDNIKSVGQCKRYSDKVSLSAVQEVVAGMAYYGSNYGFIITNNFFTKPAMNLAEVNNIQLIDRKELVDMICEIKSITDLEIPKIEKPLTAKKEKPHITQKIQFFFFCVS